VIVVRHHHDGLRVLGRRQLRRRADAGHAVWGTTQVLDVVLPGLVGVVVAVISPSSLYWVNAFTFLASAFLLRAIRRSLTGEREGEPRRLREDVLTVCAGCGPTTPGR
jgi:hypothetical protein